MRRLILLSSLISSLILLNSIGLLGQGTGTPSTLIVKVDANGYLVVASATQTNPVTSGIFSSRRLRTDANGSLQVILAGTVTPTYPMAIPASTCAAPSLGLSGGATTGIAFTATPSILNCISGNAILTITSNGIELSSAGVLAWSTDLELVRDAANILAQRNSTNTQEFRLGPTANYLRLVGDATIGGTVKPTTGALDLGSSNLNRWRISTDGHLLALGDYNIGDGAGNSPVSVFVESRVNHGALTFATLPSGIAGDVAYITDSNTATWGATAAGGGANKVLVWFNGTVWTVIGA